jgi:hypothetical protein
LIELIGLQHVLHSAGMAMRKGALVRVLAEHMTAFDLEALTNSKWHGKKEFRSSGVAGVQESHR